MNCPHCKKPITAEPTRTRICTACHHAIERYHKWLINAEGKIQHRHCDNPESYHPKSFAEEQLPMFLENSEK